MSKKINIKNSSSSISAAKSRKNEEAMDPEERLWRSWFVLVEHWQSDLRFFDDELRFLRDLIGKYFTSLIEADKIGTTRLVAEKLMKLDKTRKALEQKISEHLHHLTKLMVNPYPENAQEYKEGHVKLETETAEFFKDFREVKKELFRLAEQIMKSEKAKHLLGRRD